MNMNLKKILPVFLVISVPSILKEFNIALEYRLLITFLLLSVIIIYLLKNKIIKSKYIVGIIVGTISIFLLQYFFYK